MKLTAAAAEWGEEAANIFGKALSTQWFTLRGDHSKGKDETTETVCASVVPGVHHLM